MFHKSLGLGVAALVLLAAGGGAKASVITYDFTVTGTSGPLTGTVEHGTFSYSSSSIVPGGFNPANGSLTSLSFSWNGVAYTQTTANTGGLNFDTSGNLTGGSFGTNCDQGFCGVHAGDDANEFFISTFGDLGRIVYTVAGDTTAFFVGTVTIARAVPEPASLALFGVALAGLGVALRRRA